MYIDINGDSELMIAADKGKIKIVKALLNTCTKEDIDYQNEYGNTALYLAANHGHLEVVKLLLAANADPALKNIVDKDAAGAAFCQDFNDIVNLLPPISDEDKLRYKPPVAE